MPKRDAALLRAGLEAWEREAAAYWESVIRSPDVLHRVGRQLTESLLTAQRMEAAGRRVFTQSVSVQEEIARDLFALEQLTAQVSDLADRIARLERALHHD